MPREVEREQIAQAIRLHTLATGERPRGWYTGRCSVNTVDLVSEAGGFDYVSDTYDDDLPYWREHEGRAQLVIPYTLEANDMRFGTPNGFNSGDQFYAYLKDTFDTLYAEGAAGRPKMFSVGLHCRLIGRPGRLAALKRFIDYVKSHDKVWFARRIDIARHWAAEHPHRKPALVPSRMGEAEFVATFGGVVRNGTGLARATWNGELSPANDSAYGLFFALRTQFRSFPLEAQIDLFKEYTDLGARIDKAQIVEDAGQSQRLDVMTAQQQSKLRDLIEAYERKFDFGVIFAVRDYTTATLLIALEGRLANDRQAEIAFTSRELERLLQLQVEGVFERCAAAQA